MAGGERIRAELLRGLEEVGELDRLVAGDAGHRRLARGIAVGEAVDHRVPEALLVVEGIVRNAERLGDAAGIVDVLAGAAGALPVGRLAMVVELERHADHVVAAGLEEPRDDRGIDAARHGDDDARPVRAAGKIKVLAHEKSCRAGCREPGYAPETTAGL